MLTAVQCVGGVNQSIVWGVAMSFKGCDQEEDRAPNATRRNVLKSNK